MRGLTTSELTFPSDGEVIAATLYRPSPEDNTRLPCVVMGHGMTLTRRDGIPQYAERFARAGLLALSFDYRHWGDSTGQPRRWISLDEQLADWKAAVTYARNRPDIDPARVALWGMSMGGGHALLTAATDTRIAAVVALMPSVDPLAAQVPFGVSVRMMGLAVRERVTRRTARIAVAGPPGSLSLLTAPEALPGYQRVTADSGWQNNTNTGWLLSTVRRRPIRHIRAVGAPILFQLGERDRAVSPSAIEKAAARARRAELKRYDLDHFACFSPENSRVISRDQVDFLRRALWEPAGGDLR